MQLPSLALQLKTSEISLQPSLIDLFLTGTSAQDCPTKLMYSKAGLFFFSPYVTRFWEVALRRLTNSFLSWGVFRAGSTHGASPIT